MPMHVLIVSLWIPLYWALAIRFSLCIHTRFPIHSVCIHILVVLICGIQWSKFVIDIFRYSTMIIDLVLHSVLNLWSIDCLILMQFTQGFKLFKAILNVNVHNRIWQLKCFKQKASKFISFRGQYPAILRHSQVWCSEAVLLIVYNLINLVIYLYLLLISGHSSWKRGDLFLGRSSVKPGPITASESQ